MISGWCRRLIGNCLILQTKLKTGGLTYHHLAEVFRAERSTSLAEVRRKFSAGISEGIQEVCEKDILAPFSEVLINDEDRTKAFSCLVEYEKAKNQGRPVPSSLRPDDVVELVKCENFNQRRKFLKFLYKTERKKQVQAAKKKERRLERALHEPDVSGVPTGHIEYGIAKNSLLLRVQNCSVSKFLARRMAYASLFGPKIVIDLSYNEYMTRKELSISAQQISFLYSSNRANRYPFDVYICNAKTSDPVMGYINKKYPYMFRPDALLSFTQSCYTELFPKEKLVYLSPHAENSMKYFDHDAVYIIGAFVDTTKKYHISNEKAGREGLKCYSLPLDEHILWGSGSRSLSVNQVFDIMLEVKNTRDWKKALGSVVPKRKMQRFNAEFVKEAVLPDKLFVVEN